MKKIAVHFWILLLVCAVAGQAQGKDSAYRVGPRDQISVHVDEDEKLNGDRRVSEAGTINLSLIGDIQVAGKTPSEIALIVKKLLEAKYMQRASVDVQVTEFRSRPISVIGAVKSPATSASRATGRCWRRSPPPAGCRRATATWSTSCAGPTAACRTR